MIRGRPVKIDFSQHQEIEVKESEHKKPEAATNTIIMVTITDTRIPVTVEHLYQAFAQFGEVLKIVTFNRNNSFQALIQFRDLNVALRARSELDGKELFANGFCPMRIQYSTMTELQVKGNTERARDFTQSSGNFVQLPAPFGNSSSSSYQSSYSASNPFGLAPSSPFGGPAAFPSSAPSMANPFGSSASSFPPMLDDGSTPVLLVSGLNPDVCTPQDIQILFGVYGDVMRVKILYNKQDTALVQFATSQQARTALENLNHIEMFGKDLTLKPSKYREVELPRDGGPRGVDNKVLTMDFSDMPVHRFKIPNSKNERHICSPNPTIHLSNLSESVTEEQLNELFSQYGLIQGIQFFKNDRKMALVGYRTTAEAVTALIRLHNYRLNDKHMRISFSSKKLEQLQ
eukprot:TRINITY_DN1833_c0_g1_i3.p1 TRINITY_DN1833_c0_g1~~TRINITY_DN1833_c0_g1_i3.p1  ORF type:complete len:402 (-),score=176.72 TRINITY_DN1833_c0_g1_i3:310-1515(-)